uniref:Transmembrane protein n=1 Tax=Heterorhabditis bacteriophora TaxID=37862 RepID=A0A1I7WVU7_HETBA
MREEVRSEGDGRNEKVSMLDKRSVVAVTAWVHVPCIVEQPSFVQNTLDSPSIYRRRRLILLIFVTAERLLFLVPKIVCLLERVEKRLVKMGMK